jgi:integrase/recombinase XerD
MLSERGGTVQCRGQRFVPYFNASPRTFRHSCATHLLRGCARLVHIQHLLGHSDLNTTEIYTPIEQQDFQQAIERAATINKTE